MSNHDSPAKTLTVAAILCLVCSVLVSYAAVSLKERQADNKKLDMQKNILTAAGIFDPEKSVQEQFKNIKQIIVNLETGKIVTAHFDITNFDQRKMSKDPDKSITIPTELDWGKIKRRSKFSKIYHLIEEGQIKQIILPVHGKGLWSTMYGFIALAPDTTTVIGFAFYDQMETPGLGAEVDNPNWKALWPNKKIFDSSWNLKIEVIKGRVAATDPNAIHQIDGLSGATITSRGVSNLVRYWLGEHGFNKYLEMIRSTN